MNNLHITFLNVYGIRSKLLNPDFELLIKKYDILVFAETKTDEFDELKLPEDYTYFAKHRKKFDKKSGGIIVVYKRVLSDCLHFLKSESEFVQWVEISDKLRNDPKILFGCIYIPPEGSKYSSEEAFIELEDELVSFSRKYNNVALVGDFNSRTGTLSDIVELDENLFEILNIDEVADFVNENVNVVNKFTQKGIPHQRYSEDKTNVNNYGRKLIELCKRCSLYIANGRLHCDKLIGKNTCKDASLVDYLILSPIVFDYVSEFEVFDFNPMFSDVHNQLHFSFCIPCTKIHKVQDDIKSNTYVRWNTKKSTEFTHVLDNEKLTVLQQIEHTLNDIDTQSITQNQVNELVNEIGKVFLDTASTVFGSIGKKQVKTDTEKPWFNRECKNKRDEFHRLRKIYRNIKTLENKTNMNRSARDYRKLLHNNYKKYQENCADELRSLSRSDTKAFWKTLHKFSNKQKVNPQVDIGTFYEYFKNLNSGDEHEEELDDSFIVNICDNSVYNEILNGSIIELEISEAIKSLKNNKAPGTDNILNEYLKYSTPTLISIYCKLFNIVLDTGIIPESWTSGIIMPVFKNKGNPSDPDNFRAITLISCLGKLFTSVINSRLNIFANELSIISENQAGFRKGYSTIDNIFVLHALIELYFSFGKKLYCTFVDFKKAFDTVWRTGLWKKLQNCEIKGKCFQVIYNMYHGIKSCVKYSGEQSEFFPCLTGVRQGENLSPFLFSVFLNDLEDYFSQLDGIPLKQIKEKLQNELHIFYKLFVVLYADDTVILSETKEGMQKSLDIFQSYCEL